ncbi:hypothetical protein A2974_01685 [Candidatus Peregrinibacteria bacterium RIFCSPLOWO2_01_FULL_48_20]|nr:MAG: hypothetical protein A2974_01685 [Candidatus Peregrinibacteria bacterium RIFCSPLOWO2_01_FULL_48_20]
MAEASNSLHVTAGATPEQRRSNDETILDNRRDLAEQLEQLLVSSSGDKNALLAGLRNEGMANAQGETGLEEDDVQAIVGKIQTTIDEFRKSDPVVQSRRKAKKEATSTIEGKERIDERLQALVVEAIDALPEAKRIVRSKIRTGEEIARAIPDVEAFLAEVALMQEGTFFELNEKGQLVMRDGCKEAYGLGEDSRTAKKRQTRLIYRDETGKVQVMEGNDYFTADENGNLALSDAAKGIEPSSILMEKGLPTLQRDRDNHTGEYARMNDKGQLEGQNWTWTEDKTFDSSRARYAYGGDDIGFVGSDVDDSDAQHDYLGSRGVLRVNLNLES